MRIRHERAKVYHGSEVFDKSEIKLAFTDPKVWLSAFCQFCANICSFGFSTFLPKIINGFGYSSVRTQLLTVPVYAWAAVIYVAVSFLSDYVNRRAVFMVPMAMVTMTGYSLLIGVSMSSTAVLYFATFVTATGIYCVVGLNVTWISNSNAGYFKRATAIGLQQTIGNSAGIVVSKRPATTLQTANERPGRPDLPVDKLRWPVRHRSRCFFSSYHMCRHRVLDHVVHALAAQP
ncbi:Major facilitator superfamily [Macrophomina phaseolina MS6]|uniref:Major facilitator superfamily n=1 Tax=Macrophomina phaseolina (strain MS6) TaxID=1126212 RepID=K2RNE7_MACPH|nr:Major facilitator superfamily [Macrophomina phaseolina MS6]